MPKFLVCSRDQVAIELALSRVGNWRKRKDRLALILYFLAGELEGGGPYGSIPMFCHPPHLSIQREQETNALATINFDVSQLVQRDWPGLMTTLHRPSIHSQTVRESPKSLRYRGLRETARCSSRGNNGKPAAKSLLVRPTPRMAPTRYDYL
eukprot:g19651.t1